ncbi:MAG: hypothetical protein IJK34_05420 [Clostridia bacterium]|nr:hypothetical protein [Clostridia bacterium]
MKKFISIMLVLLLTLGLMVGCAGGDNGGVKNGGIKSNDLKDSSATQQRWLRLPDTSNHVCNLVINPDEYSGGSAGNYNRLPLNLGILDGDKKVTKTLNDLIFVVESKSANGVGGTELFVPVYDQDAEDVNTRYTVKKMTLDVDGTKVSATIPDGDETATQNITMREKIAVDFQTDIVAVVDVVSSSGVKWKVTGASQKPTYSILAQNDTDATGHFAFNLTEILSQQVTADDDISAMTLNVTLSVIGAGSPLVFQDYKVLSIEKGFQYAAADASTTWYPYGIVSTLEYPNGTAAEVMDYFAGYRTVARRITFKKDGSFYLAGKVYGKLTYDDKQNLMIVEGDGFNYVVSPKRKQYITFFNSEADLLSRTNGTSEPTESTQYWSVGCGRIELDTDLYVSVALDATASVEELCEEAKDAVGAGKTAKRIEGNIDYWDKYLAAITIPSDLILASAPEKE